MPSARSTAPDGALEREVQPAEEPAESAVKKHQCIRYHRSKERKDSTSTIEQKPREASMNIYVTLIERGPLDPSQKRTAGESTGWVEGAS